MESFLYLFIEGHSGILYGYWTPIYGVGSVFILYIYHKFLEHKKMPKWQKYEVIFLVAMIGITFIEWLGGTLIELILKEIFWSYQALPLHIGNYIALEISLIWAILSMAIIYVKRYLDRWIKMIPNYVSYTFLSLFCLDIYFLLFKIFF